MFLIDGYNLLHVTGGDRDTLIGKIRTFCSHGRYRACVVFDPTAGLPRKQQHGEVEVRGVSVGRTADDEILALLEKTGDRTAYALVSDDRELRDAAVKGGFRVVSSREFESLLEGPSPAEDPGKPEPRPGEADYWMDYFGLTDNDNC